MHNEPPDNPEDKVIYEILLNFNQVFGQLVNQGHSPMAMFGILMGYIAQQFRHYGYKQKDFVEFLESIGSVPWPEETPPTKKPKLTVVK